MSANSLIFFSGFASSTDCDTVEEHLFNALIKLRLIESRATCGYSRCGRTDKGVSAVGQVIALRMRSNLPKDGSVTTQIEEMDYCSMLNKSLPEDVRILGWSEVSDGFSSRFSAVSRTYRYFFLRKNMDLTAMQRAADLLIGDHDFRNICKMDVANVTNFRREIYKAEIVEHSGGGGNEMDEVWMLEITGVAFLWHMVRCIMALLFLVGSGKELPSIISTLFDIERVPAKPEYFMAPELPLVLYSSGFENLRFTYNTKNLFSLVSHFEALFERYHLTAVRIRNVLNFLNEVDVKNDDVSDFLSHMRKEKVDDGNVGSGSITWKDALEMLQSHGVVPAQCVSTKKERNKKYERNNVYVPLLERSRAEAYDTRIANLRGAKRSRLNVHEEKKQRAQASVSLTGSGDDICDGDEDELQKQEVGGGGSTYDFFKRMRSEGTTTTEDK